jgi:hypothetical protein
MTAFTLHLIPTATLKFEYRIVTPSEANGQKDLAVALLDPYFSATANRNTPIVGSNSPIVATRYQAVTGFIFRENKSL